jgi:3-isopropylmalate/(R)-2-methylmalate dehydratase small subunit
MAPITGIVGRAWVFEHDYINTDAIMPRMGYDLPEAEQNALILSTLRPGWVAEVQPGDILVAGRNFGTGSSRPAATLLSRIGIAAIVAESVAEVFFRNCVSYALPALDCPGVLELVTEGDELEVNLSPARLTDRATGQSLPGRPIPEMLLDTIAAGGAYAQLRAAGYMQAS